MKLHCLAFLVGSIASAATVSFRYNSINALALSPAYRSWRLFPEGEEVFPGKRITRPIYDDSFRLEATRLNGHVDFYEPQSDETFDEGNQLTLSGPKELNPHVGSIIIIEDKSDGRKTEWKLVYSQTSEELK